MRLFIFTEGGTASGLGHLIRCSAIYDAAKMEGIETKLIVDGDANFSGLLGHRWYVVAEWQNKQLLRELIQPNDVSIVDSYLADEDVYEEIALLSQQTLYIDDTNRMQYPKGIVVHPSLSTYSIQYPVVPEVRYLKGPDYVILRQPFVNVERPNVRKEVSQILITFGGSDIRNLTPVVTETLIGTFPSIDFHVVYGASTPNKGNIIEMAKKLGNVKVYENADAKLMKRLMLKSDLAVTTAGQTIYELLATQTPFIPVQVVENQMYNMKALLQLGITEQPIHAQNHRTVIQKLERAVQDLLIVEKRREWIVKYGSLIDGFGSQRIIQVLIQGE